MPGLMQRVALAGATFAMAAAAAPLAAQQAVPDPPPASVLAASPPAAPVAKIAPREHDPDYRKGATRARPSGGSTHHSAKARPAAKASGHAKASHQATTHRAAKSSHTAKASRQDKAHHAAKTSAHVKSSRHEKAARPAKHETFSARTIRQCHAMTYAQIMAHPNCRTMMQQDLAAKTKAARPAKAKSSAHHSATAKHKKVTAKRPPLKKAARHRR